MLYQLLDTEGLYVGASSALNVIAAVELAQKLGKGSKVVTILCDGAYRYQSRLFSKSWLESNGLGRAIPESLKKYAVLDYLCTSAEYRWLVTAAFRAKFKLSMFKSD